MAARGVAYDAMAPGWQAKSTNHFQKCAFSASVAPASRTLDDDDDEEEEGGEAGAEDRALDDSAVVDDDDDDGAAAAAAAAAASRSSVVKNRDVADSLRSIWVKPKWSSWS